MPSCSSQARTGNPAPQTATARADNETGQRRGIVAWLPSTLVTASAALISSSLTPLTPRPRLESSGAAASCVAGLRRRGIGWRRRQCGLLHGIEKDLPSAKAGRTCRASASAALNSLTSSRTLRNRKLISRSGSGRYFSSAAASGAVASFDASSDVLVGSVEKNTSTLAGCVRTSGRRHIRRHWLLSSRSSLAGNGFPRSASRITSPSATCSGRVERCGAQRYCLGLEGRMSVASRASTGMR